ETKCGYVLSVMAIFWVFEPVHLAVTALMPIALLPLLGILSTEKASLPYMKSANSLFIGGMLLAIAIEHSMLHKRVALKILLIVGSSVKRILFGIMLTTMFLSMWLSNTATTAMMMPVVDAMVEEFERSETKVEASVPESNEKAELSLQFTSKETGEHNNKNHLKLRKIFLLSVAFAANIGGTGTLTGTGTNLVLQGLMEDLYPNSEAISFANWFLFAGPGVLVCIILTWGFFVLFYVRNKYNDKSRNQSLKLILEKKYKELGPTTTHEKIVIALFVVVLALWFFREPGFIRGWGSFFVVKISDGTPAILIGILMFLLPTNFSQFQALAYDSKNTKIDKILDWKTVNKRMPWGVMLLLGGGFSLAEATKESGLSRWLGAKLSSLNISSPILVMILFIFIAAAVTEFCSNVAAASVILPVVNQAALNLNINPLMFMVPITIAVSFAFMLPVATPPNAIVFEHAKMKPLDM
ncbi:solute carrier family 13 member 5-like protein, partial [Dinothrombium tinctorium]